MERHGRGMGADAVMTEDEAKKRVKIWCCQCGADVEARLTNGFEVYPGRRDLWEIPLWKCDACGNHVGCHYRHHEQAMRTRPLGVIPNAELSLARQHIHAKLDPLFRDGLTNRKHLYAELARFLGRRYHTSEIRSVDEARRVYRKVLEIERALRWPGLERADVSAVR